MKNFIVKLFFIIRLRYFKGIRSKIRISVLRIKGVSIGKNVLLDKCFFKWYHKVKLGNDCVIEHNVFFNTDGAFTPDFSIIIGDKTFIGNSCEFNISDKITFGYHCNIASGCKFIDHNHGFETRTEYIGYQKPQNAPIFIDDDVWLGVNVVVLKGVTIGRGAIVGAGSVVTKSIAPYEIWAGIPAKKVGDRKE